MPKSYIKELLSYAIAAFIMGIPLQLFVDWASNRNISETPIWVYLFGSSIFSLLLTLFKYFSERNKYKK